MDYLPMTIRKQKNIALIAHDQKKRELIQWCNEHKDILKKITKSIFPSTIFATSRLAQKLWKGRLTL